MARSFSKDSNDQAAGTLKRCESKCHPDSCWSWVVCAASTLSIAIVAGVSHSFGLLLPTLTEGFEERRQTTAWVGSLYVACGCIFSPVGCHVSDRFGHKFTAILGSFFGIIGFFLASFSSKLWMMYLAYGVLSGIGHMMVYNSCYLMVLLYFVKCRSLAVGIVSSAPAGHWNVRYHTSHAVFTRYVGMAMGSKRVRFAKFGMRPVFNGVCTLR